MLADFLIFVAISFSRDLTRTLAILLDRLYPLAKAAPHYNARLDTTLAYQATNSDLYREYLNHPMKSEALDAFATQSMRPTALEAGRAGQNDAETSIEKDNTKELDVSLDP